MISLKGRTYVFLISNPEDITSICIANNYHRWTTTWTINNVPDIIERTYVFLISNPEDITSICIANNYVQWPAHIFHFCLHD